MEGLLYETFECKAEMKKRGEERSVGFGLEKEMN